MANMEFLYQNYVNTTTIVSVTSNTTSVANLFDKNYNSVYKTSGFNNDNTASSIIIQFNSNKYIDRIALQNINLKSFNIWYNTTTNNLSILNANTVTSSWVSNSLTNMYLIFSLTFISRIGIAATSTIDADSEKQIGELWISQKYCSLDNNPSFDKYTPELKREEINHKSSSGGISNYFISNYFQAQIVLDYVSSTTVSNLYNLHNEYTPFLFVQRPTGTGWDNEIYEVNWIGDFKFKKFSDNFVGNGFSGEINIVGTSV